MSFRLTRMTWESNGRPQHPITFRGRLRQCTKRNNVSRPDSLPNLDASRLPAPSHRRHSTRIRQGRIVAASPRPEIVSIESWTALRFGKFPRQPFFRYKHADQTGLPLR